MRVAIISPWGIMLSWALRLESEGCEVRWWVKEENDRVGENLIERARSLDALLEWGDKDPKTLYINEGTGLGKESDRLRKDGKLVVGGGIFNDRIERDRAFGEEVAKASNIRIPPSVAASSIDEAIKFLAGRPDNERWYFKPSKETGESETYGGLDIEDLIRHLDQRKKQFGDLPGILQKKIDGVVLSTTAWWNGKNFIRPFIGMLEYKKFMNDNVGPNTGCALNTVWFYEKDSPRIARELKWETMEKLWQKLDPCPGPYDINAIIDEKGRALFLEQGPRFGYDEDVTWPTGLTQPLGETLLALAQKRLRDIPVDTTRIYAGVRLSVEPYPWASLHSHKQSAVLTPIGGVDDIVGEEFSPYGVMKDEDGKLAVADPLGLVGVAIGTGPSPASAWQACYRVVNKMKISDVQYRTDGGKQDKKDFRIMKGHNYDVPRGA
jgi:phosphoribosylamine--glycine ligase